MKSRRLEIIRCLKCGRMLTQRNKKKLCRCCYINIWKEKNYNGKKPKGYCDYGSVDVDMICNSSKLYKEGRYMI